MSEIIQISNELSVRPITMDDTTDVVRWRANPRVKDNFLYQGEITKEVHTQWMETKVASGEVKQFIILERTEIKTDADTDLTQEYRPIGSVYFRDIDYEKMTAEYGIFIGEDDAVSKTYGSQIAAWAVSYARDVIGFNCVTLRALADNTSAVKSYEKAGFVQYDYKENFLNGRDLILMRAELK